LTIEIDTTNAEAIFDTNFYTSRLANLLDTSQGPVLLLITVKIYGGNEYRNYIA
jgi:hypothetical protein